MNRLKKAVFVAMAIFSLFGLAACNPSKQEAVDKIEGYLEQKYDEPFKVTGIGGGYGTETTNTLKAEAQPKDNPQMKFDVEITKDSEKIWDSYMNVVMADKLNEEVATLAKPVFASEILTQTYMSSPGLAFPDRKLKDKSMSVTKYLDQYPDTGINMIVFVKAPAAINASQEAAKVADMANQLINQGLKQENLIVIYLQDESFQSFNEKYEEFDSSAKVFDYFTKKENRLAIVSVHIKNGQLQESVDDIQQKLQ